MRIYSCENIKCIVQGGIISLKLQYRVVLILMHAIIYKLVETPEAVGHFIVLTSPMKSYYLYRCSPLTPTCNQGDLNMQSTFFFIQIFSSQVNKYSYTLIRHEIRSRSALLAILKNPSAKRHLFIFHNGISVR